jgi:hypothetical protein
MAKQFKRQIRMIRAVRLEAALYKDAEIAAFLKMSPMGLAQLKMDPDYIALRIQIQSGVVSDAEKELLKDTEYKYEMLRDMVPLALQGLYDAARSTNMHVKLKAAAEILDREGTMAKVSRIGLASQEQGGAGTSIDDEIAANLLDIKKIQEERAKKEQEVREIPGPTTIQ